MRFRTTDQIFSRQASMIPLAAAQQTTVAIIGCGGVGSNAADVLAGMGVGMFYLYDNGEVELENLGPQRYRASDVGRPKVEALAEYLEENYQANVAYLHGDFNGLEAPVDIVVLGLDTMDGRFAAWRGESGRDLDWCSLWIDARMGGTTVQVIAFERGKYPGYEEGWFREGFRDTLPCGEKATAFLTKGVIPGVIGSVVANWLNERPFPIVWLYESKPCALLTINEAA